MTSTCFSPGTATPAICVLHYVYVGESSAFGDWVFALISAVSLSARIRPLTRIVKFEAIRIDMTV